MSLLYSEVPVYVGAANATTITENTAYVPALDASVDFGAQLVGKRFLGQDVTSTDQFKTAGPREASISIKAILAPFTDAAFAFAKSSNQDASFPIRIGNNTYQDCFLSDFSLSVDNFAPVTIDANFVSLSPPTGGNVSGGASHYGGGTIPFDPDDIIYGHTCSLSNMTSVVNNVQSEISYKKQFNRTPIFTIGSSVASTMLLDSVESEMTVTSTGLANLIGISGDKLASDVVVELDNVDGDSVVQFPSLTMGAGARVLTEGYNINAGDSLSATATIKQIDL